MRPEIWGCVAYALEIIQGVKFRAQPSMYAKKLLVHHSRQRQGAERFHASFVDLFGVLVLALELEGEVVGQMPAFMIAAKEPEGVRIPDFEGP